jgi:hypothetical protein
MLLNYEHTRASCHDPSYSIHPETIVIYINNPFSVLQVLWGNQFLFTSMLYI